MQAHFLVCDICFLTTKSTARVYPYWSHVGLIWVAEAVIEWDQNTAHRPRKSQSQQDDNQSVQDNRSSC